MTHSKYGIHFTVVLAVIFCLSTNATFAQSANSAAVANNTPGFIKHAKDLGPANPTAVISVTAWLNLHNQNQLDRLVQQQSQKGSANYHKWITQAQFNANFAPTSQEVKSVQNFLSAHGLTLLTVA